MDMAPAKFDGGKILSQLRSAGMESVLRLMQSGFPCRTTFADLHNRYSKASSPLMSRLDGRLFCKCIFYSLGLNEFDYRFGTTKVFFRAGKFKQFDDLMRNDNVEELIQKAQSWLNRFRWKKAIYTVLSCIKIKKIHEEKIIRLEAQRLAEELMAKQKMVEEEAAKLVAQQTLIVEQEAKKEEEAKKMTAEKSTQSTVYDVQSWSYAKLRDAINTETGKILLSFCL
jgi:myosin-6